MSAPDLSAAIVLASDGKEPLYRQLRAALEHAIVNGAVDPIRPLPSSRELARQLRLSRNTVNSAYDELIVDGFVTSRPRSGLFVNKEMLPYVTGAPAGPSDDRVDWDARLIYPRATTLPEIAKDPDWYRCKYPFIAGQVDYREFPARAWSRALRDALLGENAYFSLRDAVNEDDPLLLDALCRHILPTRGIHVSSDQVLVTMGSQQGLSMLSDVLLVPGSSVAVEDPGYLDARHIFARAGAQLVPFAVDRNGLALPSNAPATDLVYVTPSHHNPTNVTMTAGRRRDILRYAAERDAVVIEDDYDSEFRYHGGTPTPALRAMDSTGRVVYLGTFSKFLAPGLRLGFVVADVRLIERLREQRRYSIRHPPGHLQRAMALMILSGQYSRAIRHRRIHLQRNYDAILTAVNERLPWQTPRLNGGVSLWMAGPPELNCLSVAKEARRRGVYIERGDIYFLRDDPPMNHFRLGFAAISTGAIADGIEVLGRVIDAQVAAGAR